MKQRATSHSTYPTAGRVDPPERRGERHAEFPTVHAAVVLLAFLLAGCGQDYRPPQLETTGRPPSPLGQVVDLEASLPNLRIQGSIQRGLELELRLEIEETGPGRLDARYFAGQARYDMTATSVEDLSNGRTTVTVTANSWTTGRIGPLRVDGTVFEVVLDGDPQNGGWQVSGVSWEGQTGLFGSFQGWRRHRFLVTATDFFAGGRVVEVAWVKGREIRVRNDLELVSSDPFLRVTGRAVFVVNRLTFDNLQRLDPDENFRTAWQAGMGAGSNPQDVLLLSQDKAYVTRYEPPFNDVAVISPRGGTIVDSIPLEDLADNVDGTPRAARILAVDGSVFVGLQDIDRSFSRYEEGKLAVIDPALDEVVGVIPLGGKNPGPMEPIRGDDGRDRLYVALAGIFPGLLPQELSGGVVVVDVVNRAVERMALDDDDAGGNIGALALFTERLGYVVVSDASFTNRLVAFNPETAEALRTVFETRDLLAEIEVGRGGVLAVPDRSFAQPRLCLYQVPADPAGQEALLGCANLPLPPFSVEALD